MYKKIFLLLLSILFLLTGCNNTDLPAEQTNTDDSGLSSNVSPETENSDITTSPENKDTPERENSSENSTAPESGDLPEDGDTSENNTIKNGNATENPEETLNNILNELQELDELMNGTE